jgi:dynein intermediate chain, cytosolic
MHSANAREAPQLRKFTGHEAPITKIALHPGKSMSESKANAGILTDMSELMLSASMDWKIKLWYPQSTSSTDVPSIYTFESSQEFVYDVQWSPVHPSIFASVDGDGFIDIWDINKDVEQPIARKKVNEHQVGSAGFRDVDE